MIPPNTGNKKTPFPGRHGNGVVIFSLKHHYHFLLALVIFSLPHKTLSLETCSTYYCPSVAAVYGGDEPQAPEIRFPFIAAGSNHSRRCGYPGFRLTCDGQNQQPILTLPSSGEFSVQVIDYVNQVVLVSDPDNCLPKRILNLDVARSPFSGVESRNYTFLNCTNSNSSTPVMAAPIPCLSGGNHTVYATFVESAVETLVGSGECWVMKSVWSPSMLPVMYNDASVPDLDRAVMALSWDVPDCSDCEHREGSCGFSSDSGLEVGCSLSNSTREISESKPSPQLKMSGASKIVKYGLILGLGIPGFIFMVGLTFYFSGRIRTYNQRRRQLANTEFSPSIFPQPAVVLVGLDGQTIESYPKTLLGESGRLPNPSDALCAICLSEYEATETLRTIPDCNHYFHAQCIDEWLRLKGTCPLCRNSPGK